MSLKDPFLLSHFFVEIRLLEMEIGLTGQPGVVVMKTVEIQEIEPVIVHNLSLEARTVLEMQLKKTQNSVLEMNVVQVCSDIIPIC